MSAVASYHAEARLSQIVESEAWPVPILEVQWAVAAVGGVPGDAGCLVSGVVAEAAVPVPIFAVRSGDARVPREEPPAAVLVATVLVAFRPVTMASAAWPVPMAADQCDLVGSFEANSAFVVVRSRESRMRFPRTVSTVRCSVVTAAAPDAASPSEVRLYRAKTVSASAVGNSQRFEIWLPPAV